MTYEQFSKQVFKEKDKIIVIFDEIDQCIVEDTATVAHSSKNTYIFKFKPAALFGFHKVIGFSGTVTPDAIETVNSFRKDSFL
jgi:hypothetical protein